MHGIKYRARFRDRPDLDSEDFKDYAGTVALGREFAIEEDEGKTWRVAEIKSEGARETIIFEPVG